MIISTQSHHFMSTFGDIEGLRLIREAGFQGIDLNFFDWTPYIAKGKEAFDKYTENAVERYTKIKEECARLGIHIGQAHAPFPSEKKSEPYDSTVIYAFHKCIEMCGIVGAPYVVIHPIDNKCGPKRIYHEGYEEAKAANMEFFSQFFDTCKKHNVKLAIENVMEHSDHPPYRIVAGICSYGDEICDYIDTLNEMAGCEIAVGCLDTGHAISALGGDFPWVIAEKLGHRLKCLHLQDSTVFRDMHTAPYLGDISWDRVFTTLKNIGYDGDISFEAGAFFRTFGYDLIRESSRMLYRIGVVLCEKNGLE